MLKSTIVCLMLAVAFAQHQGLGHSHGLHQDHGHRLAHAPSQHHTGEDAHAKILSESSNVHHEGFEYHFATSNGINAKASGDSHGRIHGDFAWISPEGASLGLSYVADESGYHPSGELLPTPPPIPEAILKSLKYIASHPSKEDDQHYQEHHSHEHHGQHDHHGHGQHKHGQHDHEQPLFNIRRF